MRVSTDHIAEIAAEFPLLKNDKQLYKLLDRITFDLGSKREATINYKNFKFLFHPRLRKHRFKTFSIAKKSGGVRTIHAPVTLVAITLKRLNLILQEMVVPHKCATGFVPGKSIVDNAKRHVDKNYVYNIDLKDFFHSFTLNRVKLGFMRPPFNLKGEQEPVAFKLAALCTFEMEIDGETRAVLPQGSPCSPTLTNHLCQTLDRRLDGLARRFGVDYTRYADDITFSSQHNVYNDEAFQQELHRIIEEDQGFKINPKKTRLQKRGYRQEVTGLVTNAKVNVKRRYVKEIRRYLYLWERYGVDKAQEIFLKEYASDKADKGKMVPSLDYVLAGKLNFLSMVKGEKNPTYLKLQQRFDLLCDGLHSVEELLQTWEHQGLEAAVELYDGKPIRKKLKIQNGKRQLTGLTL